MKHVILRLLPDSGKSPGSIRFLFLFLSVFLTSATFAQVSVSGKITDDTNASMPGVNVVVKGTTNGTTSDADGAYKIDVPEGDQTLVFSFIGFATQEIAVGGKTTIDVQLLPSAEALADIVVVGYGVQQKRDITGAIVKVNSEVLMQTASPNVLDQLKGRAAGVDITSNSAVPGGGFQIRIRGNRGMTTNNPNTSTSTANTTNDARNADEANGPLLVVDGIPYNGNLNDISPNDIASLEILKDASATAIYGSRGSGGVILVSTKRGATGKAVFTYDGYYGVSTVMDELRVFNGPEFAQFKLDAAAGNSVAPNTNAYAITANEQAALDAGISTNWQDLIYQKAPITNHNLSISGGTEKTKYSMSAGYFLQGGIIPNQNYSRYSLRTTLDNELNKFLKVGINSINSISYQNIPGGSGVPGGLMRLTPLTSPYNPDGSVNTFPQAQTFDGASVSPLTLETKEQAILNKTRRVRTFNSLYAEINIIKGLKYRANLGLDFFQDKTDVYSGPGTYVNNSTLQSQSTGSVRNTDNYQVTFENLLLFEKTFSEKHKVGFTGLFSIQKNTQQASYVFGQGIPFDYMQNSNLFQANSTNVGNSADNFLIERGLVSYMARGTYSYDGKYSATATVRTDGASVLSPGNQYYTYPALGLAWNISNEGFMSSISAINELKFRAGWGVTASQAGVRPYQTLGDLASSAYNFGQSTAGQQVGYTVNTLANGSLEWQSTSQYDIGLDFGLLKNRLRGAIDYYKQETSGILLNVSLPPSSGANSTIKNIGTTKGYGFELTLGGDILKMSNGLVWSADMNYFFNREEITELSAPGVINDIGNGWFVGHPLSVIYDYEKLGIWQTGDPGLTTQVSPVQYPGDIKVLDWNTTGALKPGDTGYGVPDGRITADDRKIIGNFQPKFDAGFSTAVSFKGIDLSISVYGRMGMKMIVPYLASEPGGSNTAGYSFFNQSRPNQLKVDYWTPTHTTGTFPQPDAGVGAPLYSSVMSYMDGSFIKCRTINLGYTIPSSIVGKYGITSLKIYFSAVNPFIIYSPFVKDGFGPDPEGNGYGGGVNANGTLNAVVNRVISVNANNPSTRQFMIGMNLKF